MQINNRQVFFVVGSVGFFFVGLFVSVWLVVGAGFGAFGMFYVLTWYEKWLVERRKDLIRRKEVELDRLRRRMLEHDYSR